jgi:hypothetical protein
MGDESLDRALSDLELLASAYPDETHSTTARIQFPLHVTLKLSDTAHCQLEYTEGYPETSNVQISSYRSSRSDEKARMEAAVTAIRRTAEDCLQEGIEGGLACCAAAMEAWSDEGVNTTIVEDEEEEVVVKTEQTASKQYEWMSGEPLLDRKSTFQAHVCRIFSQSDVSPALQQLLQSNSKLRRATHHMVRSV